MEWAVLVGPKRVGGVQEVLCCAREARISGLCGEEALKDPMEGKGGVLLAPKLGATSSLNCQLL